MLYEVITDMAVGVVAGQVAVLEPQDTFGTEQVAELCFKLIAVQA